MPVVRGWGVQWVVSVQLGTNSAATLLFHNNKNQNIMRIESVGHKQMQPPSLFIIFKIISNQNGISLAQTGAFTLPFHNYKNHNKIKNRITDRCKRTLPSHLDHTCRSYSHA
eukprot:jgi/Botrbrau1/17562/Bobra.0166s0010.1